MRFRVANLASCVVLAFFNAMIAAWPMVGMNAALVVVNAYFIGRLTRAKRAGKAFRFALAKPGDQVVAWFVSRHGGDMEAFHPLFEAHLDAVSGKAVAPYDVNAPGPVVIALLFHDDAAIGLTAFRTDPADPAAAELLADYVVPSYRDYAPGGFVYSPEGPLVAAGVRRVTADASIPAVADYLHAMGFTPAGDGRLAKALD
jgi:hypothetical protein